MPRAEARAALLNSRHAWWRHKAHAAYRVRFETGKGNFVVEVRRDWAPHGADRLYNLVRAGFFDDARFFQVRAGFVAQFGIPGDPAVAAVSKSQTIPDDPARQSNTRGTVSYAMTGPRRRRRLPPPVGYGTITTFKVSGMTCASPALRRHSAVDNHPTLWDIKANAGSARPLQLR